MYNNQTKSKVNALRVKSPTKANTDLHNGDLKDVVFSFSDSACYHQVSSIMLNYHSIIHLIIPLTLTLLQCSFNTQLRVDIIHTLKCSFNTGDFAV